jgi:uncharacterized protein YkwD
MSKRFVSFVILISLYLSVTLLVACKVEIVDMPPSPTAPVATSVAPSPAPIYTPTLTSMPGTTPPPTEIPVDRDAVEHTVQAGDTLLGLATMYNVPMAAIQLENDLGDSIVVQAGQVLSIPSPDGWEGASRFWIVHVVKSGETLVAIAKAYGLKAEEIKAVNGLSDADMIIIGHELVIPLDAPAVSPDRVPAPTDTPVPTPSPVPTPTVTTTITASTATSPTASMSLVLPTPSLSPTDEPPALAPAPPPADVADWTYEVVRLINEARAQHGLPPLVTSGTLAQVAQAHADDCLQRGWGSHTGSDGSNVKTRMQRAGYDPVRWSECWAHTQSPQEAMGFWMNETPPNDPHRRTILSPWLTEIGVGVVKPDWGYYLFADFGTPRE